MTDFSFANHGSLCLLQPRSRKAKRWAEANINIDDQTQFWNGAIVIEPRYVAAIIDAIVEAHLTIGA